MSKKYDFMEVNENADFFLESKHIRVQEDFTEAIHKALLKSPYTKGELAERLSWSLERLAAVMSGYKTITFYEAVHVAGALGYELKVSIKEINGEG